MFEAILSITQRLEELDKERISLLCELDAIREKLPESAPHEFPLTEPFDIDDFYTSEWN